MGIDGIGTADFSVVSRHCILGDGVLDLLTVFILGQIDEVPLPVIRSGDRSVLDLGGLAVNGLVQADGDAFRAQTVLVVVVVPSLHTSDINGLRHMGVDQVVLINHTVIAFHHVLSNGVDDPLLILVLVQVSEGPGPVIRFGHGLAVDLHAVRQQVDGDAGGAQAVLIVRIIPVLDATDVHLTGGVGILHVIAADFGRVTLHHILSDGVDDQLATFVLGQLAEIPGPVIACGDSPGGHFLMLAANSLPQADGDLCRTLAILVVVVLPGLRTGNLHLLVLMGVGQLVADIAIALGQGGHLLGDGAGIAVNRLFLKGIDDLAAVLILGQILKDPVPVAIRGGGAVLASALAVRQEVNRQAGRTLAVVVVVVVPDLVTQNVDGFFLVGVGHVVPVHLGGVAGDGFLLDGVDMLLTVGVLGQVIEGPGPAILLGNGLAGVLLAVLHQVDGDGIRTQAVVVVVVVPGLFAFHINGLILMGIGEVHAAALGGVALHGDLMHVVVDLLAAEILGHVVEGPGPAIRSGDGLAGHLSAVSQQDDHDALRTQAVVIVIVVPGFLTGQIDGFDLMLVDDIIAADRGGVALGHVLLPDGVGDRLAVLVGLGQVGKAPGPAMGGGGNMLLNHHAIRQQLDGHAGGTQAVAVVIVLPGLLARDLHRVDAPGVGQVPAVGGADVTGHRLLLNGVLDFHAVLILGQILKHIGLGGRIGHSDGLAVDLHAVGIQIHSQVHRAHAAAEGGLARPGLGAADVDLLIIMRVDQGLAFGNIFRGVALGHIELADAVHDLVAIAVQLRQGRPDIIPAVRLLQFHRIAVLLAVGQQLHLDGGGADAVGVMAIVPDLFQAEHGIPGGFLGVIVINMALSTGKDILTDDGAVEIAGVLGHIRVRRDDMTDPVLGGQGDRLGIGEVEHHSRTGFVLLADGRLGAVEMLARHMNIAAVQHRDGGVNVFGGIADDVDLIHAIQALDDHIIAHVDGDYAVYRLDDGAACLHGGLVSLDDLVSLAKVEEIVIDVHGRSAVVARTYAINAVLGQAVLRPGRDGIGAAHIQRRHIAVVAGIVHGVGRQDLALDKGGRQIFAVSETGNARITRVHALHQDGAHHMQLGMRIAEGQHIAAVQEGHQVVAVPIVSEHIIRRGTLRRLGRIRQGDAGEQHQHGEHHGSQSFHRPVPVFHQ